MDAELLSSTADKRRAFREDVLNGLLHSPKFLLPKHLYDKRGSELFEDICRLDEYYPTRTELGILGTAVPELTELIEPGTILVELGSGESVKTEILLRGASAITTYAPVDISVDELHVAVERLLERWPELQIVPVVGDFTRDLALPSNLSGRPTLLFFPGSTIGNFEPEDAERLLVRWRTSLMPDHLLLGVDLRKDPGILLAAYDDAVGVTAEFNLNYLARINRELGGTFDLSGFRHEARWNPERSRIEMHLVSLRQQTVRVAERDVPFVAGESIHTENSYKYRHEDVVSMAVRAGWRQRAYWTDSDALFGVFLFGPM